MLELRDYQEDAIRAMLGADEYTFAVPFPSGVVKAGAGAGKTIIAACALQQAAVLSRKPLKVAWLGHTTEQVEQAKKACAMFPADGLEISFYCYAAYPWVGDCDIVVADECHRTPAETFRKIIEDYGGVKWGLSATPEREDERKNDVFALIGPVLFEINRDELVERGYLCPCKVTFLEANEFGEFEGAVSEVADKLIAERKKKWAFLFANPAAAGEQIRRCTWQAVLQEAIYNNPARDAAIAEVASRHVGESILIIVGSIEHGKKLLPMIPGSEVVSAKVPKKKRADIMKRFGSGDLKVLIATSLADEGLDIPRASVLILAAAGKSSGKAEQRTGRVLRTFEGKEHGVVYDFNDHQHTYLHAQSAKRMKVYKKLGYSMEVAAI